MLIKNNTYKIHPIRNILYRVLFMKKRIICIFLAILLSITAFVIRAASNYSIACDTYAEQGIKGSLAQDINKAVSQKLNDSNISYNTFAKIYYLTDGRIGSITVDTISLNLLATELSNQIYECVENSENNFGVPFGNILGDPYSSGIGPKIRVNVVPVGSVDYEIQSELISGGINQALHRISIRFETSINCLVPFHQSNCAITTTIIVAETLIVGEIPDTILSSWR